MPRASDLATGGTAVFTPMSEVKNSMAVSTLFPAVSNALTKMLVGCVKPMLSSVASSRPESDVSLVVVASNFASWRCFHGRSAANASGVYPCAVAMTSGVYPSVVATSTALPCIIFFSVAIVGALVDLERGVFCLGGALSPFISCGVSAFFSLCVFVKKSKEQPKTFNPTSYLSPSFFFLKKIKKPCQCL